MSQLTLDPVLVALRTQLVARAGLAGVEVFTAPRGDEAAPSNEWIEMGDETDATITPALLATSGRRDDEMYDIHGWVEIVVAGAGETVWSAARQRAAAILDEIEQSVRLTPKLGGAVTGLISCLMARTRTVQGIVPERGRGVHAEFWLSVHARV